MTRLAIKNVGEDSLSSTELSYLCGKFTRDSQEANYHVSLVNFLFPPLTSSQVGQGDVLGHNWASSATICLDLS